MSSRTVFYELNEVPFKVFDHYCDLFPDSALARLKDRSTSYQTVTEDTGHLSPWVTWPTLHRGVLNDEHEITDFGQDLTAVNKDLPPVWDILARRGVNVGMFGSLHTHPLPDNVQDYAFYVPDTFAAGPECFPDRFEVFQAFNLAMAGKSASQVNGGIALKEAARFLAASPGLGLSGRTIGKLGQQIVSERFNKDRLVRRRTSQVQIAFDFFLKALWQDRPDASFFFTNHVASSMHRYWPSLFPDDYETLAYDADWLASWKGEIPFTLHEANYQVSKLMAFVEKNTGYRLIVSTSMGQAAVQGKERVNRKVIITGLPRLMDGLGFEGDDWQKRPSMVPQYNAWIADAKVDAFRQKMGALSINGKTIDVEHLGNGVHRLEFYLANEDEITVEFEGNPVDPATFGIVNVDLQDAAGANAYHIPEGMLVVYDPTKTAVPSVRHHISTLDVAPSILRNFGVDTPGYMQSGFTL